jgi:hypothetical protein
MAINMLCPNGHHLVTEDQYAGRTVRCSHCQAMIIVPAAPQTAVTTASAAPPRPERNESDVIGDEDILDGQDVIEDEPPRPRRRAREYEYEEEDDEERPRRKKKLKRALTQQQMSMTSLGLAFYYADILTVLIGLVIVIGGSFLVGVAAAGSTAGRTPGGAAGAVGAASVIVLLGDVAMVFIAPLLGITGGILCCWVPSKTGAKPLIIASAALSGGALLCPLLAIIVGAGGALSGLGAGAGAMGMVLILFSPLLSLAGFILFMLFLRQLATYLSEHGAADEAMSIIIQSLLLLIGAPIGLFILAMIAAALSRDRASTTAIGCIFGLFILAAAIAWLVFAIKLLFAILNLIASLRQVLRSQYNV